MGLVWFFFLLRKVPHMDACVYMCKFMFFIQFCLCCCKLMVEFLGLIWQEFKISTFNIDGFSVNFSSCMKSFLCINLCFWVQFDCNFQVLYKWWMSVGFFFFFLGKKGFVGFWLFECEIGTFLFKYNLCSNIKINVCVYKFVHFVLVNFWLWFDWNLGF